MLCHARLACKEPKRAFYHLLTEQQNHRTIECFGLEGTFRGHPAQPPFSEQGYLQLDQVAQSPVQPGLEGFQGWGLHYLSGQLVPVFHHPYHKNFFLVSSLSKKFLPYIHQARALIT